MAGLAKRCVLEAGVSAHGQGRSYHQPGCFYKLGSFERGFRAHFKGDLRLISGRFRLDPQKSYMLIWLFLKNWGSFVRVLSL